MNPETLKIIKIVGGIIVALFCIRLVVGVVMYQDVKKQQNELMQNFRDQSFGGNTPFQGMRNRMP